MDSCRTTAQVVEGPQPPEEPPTMKTIAVTPERGAPVRAPRTHPSILLVGPYDPKGGEYTFLAPPLGVWRLAGVLRGAGVTAERLRSQLLRSTTRRRARGGPAFALVGHRRGLDDRHDPPVRPGARAPRAPRASRCLDRGRWHGGDVQTRQRAVARTVQRRGPRRRRRTARRDGAATPSRLRAG